MRLAGLLAVFIACVHADLVCLQGNLSPSKPNIWCHFSHNPPSAAGNAAIRAIQGAVKDAKAVAGLAVTRLPVKLIPGSDSAPLKDTSFDIEFSKKTAKTTVSIYSLLHWADLSACVIDKAVAGDTAPDGQVSKCFGEDFRRISSPATFNIDDPKKKLSTSLGQLAPFMQPISPVQAGPGSPLNVFDLGIPGAYDVVRVSRQANAGNGSEFTTQNDALAARDKIRNAEWAATACKSDARSGNQTVLETSKRRRSRLHRRAPDPGLKCNFPVGPTNFDPKFDQNGFDDPGMQGGPWRGARTSRARSDAGSEASVPLATFDRRNSQYMPESALSAPPALVRYTQPKSEDAQDAKDRFAIAVQRDINENGLASIAWETDLWTTTTSWALFSLLRRIVSNVDGKMEYAYREMGWAGGAIVPGIPTTVTPRLHVLESNDQYITELGDCESAIRMQAYEVAYELLTYELEYMDKLEMEVSYTYIAPLTDPANQRSPFADDVYRNFRTDPGLFTLIATDQPGLVVQHEGETFRPPVRPNTWTLIPGRTYDDDDPPVAENGVVDSPATRYSIFDQGITTRGFMAVSVQVKDPASADLMLRGLDAAQAMAPDLTCDECMSDW